MSQPEQYDVVILGSGAGGKLLSWSLASQGKKTAVIERKYVGGSCPNIACLPSKNVIHSAKVANYFRRRAEFGIAADGWKVNMAARPRSQAEDGRWPRRNASAEVQGKWRRADHGQRSLRRTQDH